MCHVLIPSSSRLEYTERTCCGSNYTNTDVEPSCAVGDETDISSTSTDSRGEVVSSCRFSGVMYTLLLHTLCPVMRLSTGSG